MAHWQKVVDYERNLKWQDYYRRRLYARAGLVAAIVLFWLLGNYSKMVEFTLAMVFALGAGITAVCFVPMFYWESWRCPKCGHEFVGAQFGPNGILVRLWKLWLPSRCSSCRTPDSDRL